jgi:hypothetical protein
MARARRGGNFLAFTARKFPAGLASADGGDTPAHAADMTGSPDSVTSDHRGQ